MRYATVAILIVAMGGCDAATNSPAPGGLHSGEYHAAYCMGVLGTSINGIRSAMASPPISLDAIFGQAQAAGSADIGNSEELLSWSRSAAAKRRIGRAGMRARLAAATNRLDRFAATIDSSGVLVDLDRPLAPAAMSVAMKQGATDATQCDATKLRCVFLYSPHFNADQPQPPDAERKLASCVRQEQACQRAQPCLPPE